MALLMVLSSIGIEIGPLIAGAGVVGVAIGFGAQTLVKDVISGIFYLLDDAFRVGEYIQSGTYKGTVESFSLRSVKLRHHRGYLFTVPFGELGAVQNMSRDWVIDKFAINVDYQTDIEKARKIIKKIGQQFAEDPEYAPHIIEPLKMQGVQNFGDFGIELRIKMMTKPGEQFVIRRKAYVAIKKAFEEDGIKIPFPTVMVREGESPAAAAAHLQTAARQGRRRESGSGRSLTEPGRIRQAREPDARRRPAPFVSSAASPRSPRRQSRRRLPTTTRRRKRRRPALSWRSSRTVRKAPAPR